LKLHTLAVIQVVAISLVEVFGVAEDIYAVAVINESEAFLV